MKYFRKAFVLSLATLMLVSIVPLLQAQEPEKININQASVEEIAQLDRVGLKYAERIVKYREDNGPFESPEDILKVRGIGPKTFEANRDRITIE